MMTLSKIAAALNVTVEAVVVDDLSGFATSFRNQPANGWTVIAHGKAFDVWTAANGDVLGVLPA
jgi:hypothetical protein